MKFTKEYNEIICERAAATTDYEINKNTLSTWDIAQLGVYLDDIYGDGIRLERIRNPSDGRQAALKYLSTGQITENEQYLIQKEYINLIAKNNIFNPNGSLKKSFLRNFKTRPPIKANEEPVNEVQLMQAASTEFWEILNQYVKAKKGKNYKAVINYIDAVERILDEHEDELYERYIDISEGQ